MFNQYGLFDCLPVLEDAFKTNVKALVENTFQHSNVMLKRVNGHAVNGNELADHIKVIFWSLLVKMFNKYTNELLNERAITKYNKSEKNNI